MFAEVFHRLGYLSVGKLVSGDRWQEMTSGLRDRFEACDVTQDGARGLPGEPSLVIDRKVLCYVPEDPAAGWLFIDCHAEQARRYDVRDPRTVVVFFLQAGPGDSGPVRPVED